MKCIDCKYAHDLVPADNYYIYCEKEDKEIQFVEYYEFCILNKGEQTMFTDEQRKEFENLCRPVIKWINDNGDPHMTAIIDTVHYELLSGEIAQTVHDYIRD